MVDSLLMDSRLPSLASNKLADTGINLRSAGSLAGFAFGLHASDIPEPLFSRRASKALDWLRA